jgi:hypothetical protein
MDELAQWQQGWVEDAIANTKQWRPIRTRHTLYTRSDTSLAGQAMKIRYGARFKHKSHQPRRAIVSFSVQKQLDQSSKAAATLPHYSGG